MKTLYIGNPIENWNFEEDTTPVMMSEVVRRAGRIFFAEPSWISNVSGKIQIKYCEVFLKEPPEFYEIGELSTENAEFFDVIHIRTDPPFDMNYYYATILLESVSTSTLVLNNPASLRSLNEKLSILNFPHLITDTIISGDPHEIADFTERCGGTAIAKHLGECSSKGIMKLDGGEEAVKSKSAQMLRDWNNYIMVQRFIPEVLEGEARITIIDGKPAGFMKKIPASGNFLASIDFGASVTLLDPSEREMQIGTEVGRFLKKNGIIFAALDVIHGNLSEINITSPGLLRHTNRVMKKNLQEDLENAVEQWFSIRCNIKQFVIPENV